MSSQFSRSPACVFVLHRRRYLNNQFGMDVIDILVHTGEHPSRKKDKPTTHLDKTTDIITDKTID